MAEKHKFNLTNEIQKIKFSSVTSPFDTKTDVEDYIVYRDLTNSISHLRRLIYTFREIMNFDYDILKDTRVFDNGGASIFTESSDATSVGTYCLHDLDINQKKPNFYKFDAKLFIALCNDLYTKVLAHIFAQKQDINPSNIVAFDKLFKETEGYEKLFSQQNVSFNNLIKDAEKIRDKANTLNTEHALKGFKNLYSNESKKQLIESNKWFKWTKQTVVTLLISILVCFVINIFTNNSSLFIYANEVTFNLVLLSIALWCARMYSINKALEINYMHKSVSADALMSYIASIKDGDELKNTILLESSRMIFSLPETGLTKSNSLDLKLLDTFRDISQVKQANNITEQKTNN